MEWAQSSRANQQFASPTRWEADEVRSVKGFDLFGTKPRWFVPNYKQPKHHSGKYHLLGRRKWEMREGQDVLWGHLVCIFPIYLLVSMYHVPGTVFSTRL